MSTAIGKFARTAALAAVLSTSAFFGASSANALTLLTLGNTPTTVVANTNYNLGNLDLAGDDEFRIEGFVQGTGSVSVNTFVSSPFSEGLAAINLLLSKLTGTTGTVSGSWGGSALTFTKVANTWVADGLVGFTGTGLGNAKLLVVNYTNFNRVGQFSATLNAVPLPGAAVLLLSGLGGLGFLSRRRKSKAA